VSNDLRVDAERDLRDISASRIEVYPLNKVHIMYMCICQTPSCPSISGTGFSNQKISVFINFGLLNYQ